MSERRFGGTRRAAFWLGPQLVQPFAARAARMRDNQLLQLRRWVDCVSESSVLRFIEHRWAAVTG
jgi:hypothetical protein